MTVASRSFRIHSSPSGSRCLGTVFRNVTLLLIRSAPGTFSMPGSGRARRSTTGAEGSAGSPDHQTIVNQARVAFAMVASCPTFAVASSGVASCPTLAAAHADACCCFAPNEQLALCTMTIAEVSQMKVCCLAADKMLQRMNQHH